MTDKLKELYDGNINNVDLFVGGLAESHVEGGEIGETFGTIIKMQFEELRDGDRFYYENPDYGLFDKKMVEGFKKRGLCDVINDVIEYTDGANANVAVGRLCVKNPYSTFLGKEENISFWEKHMQADILPILMSVFFTMIGMAGGLFLVFKFGGKGLERLGVQRLQEKKGDKGIEEGFTTLTVVDAEREETL